MTDWEWHARCLDCMWGVPRRTDLSEKEVRSKASTTDRTQVTLSGPTTETQTNECAFGRPSARVRLSPRASGLVRSSVASSIRSLSRASTVPRVTKPARLRGMAFSSPSRVPIRFGTSNDIHTLVSPTIERPGMVEHGPLPPRDDGRQNRTGFHIGGLSSSKLVTEFVHGSTPGTIQHQHNHE